MLGRYFVAEECLENLAELVLASIGSCVEQRYRDVITQQNANAMIDKQQSPLVHRVGTRRIAH